MDPDQSFPLSETSRVQEDPPGVDLSDLQHDAAQLRPMVGHVTDLLLRVRGPAVGHRKAGGEVHGVWREVAREMQGPPKRRLLAT